VDNYSNFLIESAVNSISYHQEVDKMFDLNNQTISEGADEEYRNRLKKGQDYEQAQRAGSEMKAKELKSKLGKGGLGHSAYGVANYENKDRQKDAQTLRSIRDVRKEAPGMTSRQRRIKELSAKYQKEEYFMEMLAILEEAGYLETQEDFLGLAEAALSKRESRI
jgi:hypothetical protein